MGRSGGEDEAARRWHRRARVVLTAAVVAAASGVLASRLGAGWGADQPAAIPAWRLTYVTMAASGAKDAAVLDSLAPARAGGPCSLALYLTTDRAASWSAPVVFGDGTPCAGDLSVASLALSAAGQWWLAVPGKLYVGSLRAAAPPHRVMRPSTDRPCSVSATGMTVYLTAGAQCFDPSSLYRSLDAGASWSAVSLPAELGPTAPLLVSPRSFALIAWPGHSRSRTMPISDSPLAAVLRNGNGPFTTSVLPCPAGRAKRTVWQYGFIAASGQRLVALCSSGLEAYNSGALEVVGSDDGGHRWSERCGNGAFGFANSLGSCPGYGIPTGLAIAASGAIVMSLSQVGLVVSTDAGRSWVGVPPAGYPFVTLSSSGGCVWALEYGPDPVSRGGWLAESRDGTTWRRLRLPPTG